MINISSNDLILFENKVSFARFSKGYVYFEDSLVDENSKYVQFFYNEKHSLIILKFQSSQNNSATHSIVRSSSGYRVQILPFFNQFRLDFSDKKCAMLLVQVDNVTHWAIDLQSSAMRINSVVANTAIPRLKITSSKATYMNQLLLQSFGFAKLNNISDEIKELVVSKNQNNDNDMRKTTRNLSYFQELTSFNSGDWFHALLVNLSEDTKTFQFNVKKPCQVITIQDIQIEGSPCFVAGTQILTKNGYKSIEDIKTSKEITTTQDIQIGVKSSEALEANNNSKLDTKKPPRGKQTATQWENNLIYKLEKSKDAKMLRYDQMKIIITDFVKKHGETPFTSDIFPDIPSKTSSRVLKVMAESFLLKCEKVKGRNFYSPDSLSDWK